ncbi:hypothetical protein [Pseudomonas sp. B26(2017)]|uniref:hypothetical protein n=1 Tax=Pseudomonas sp. B26(2017) TaxID=1981732 RepID=UPI000A1DEB95|nr:hypothetical protein [Pseudomonas sp. B26(2017)]
MSFDIDVIAKLLAPTISAIAFIVKRLLEKKPKLITYLVHSSEVPLGDEQKSKVNFHSIVVRNAGKKTANNIRIGHQFLPAFQINPQLAHEIIKGSNNAAEILIPTLVPGEQINISYLYFPPILWSQIHSYCKSDEMPAKYVNIIPAAQLSTIQTTTIWGLMFIGASTLLYWLIYWILTWIKFAT